MGLAHNLMASFALPYTAFAKLTLEKFTQQNYFLY